MAHFLCAAVVTFRSLDAVMLNVYLLCCDVRVSLFYVTCRRCSLALRHIQKDHIIDAYSHDQFYTVSLLSRPRTQHIHRVEGLRPLGHDVTAVELRNEINRTCLLSHPLTDLLTYSLNYVLTHSIIYSLTYLLNYSLI